MIGNVKSQSFIEGESVICPAHGLGKVVSVETYHVDEKDMECYKVFFESDKLTLMIPVDRAREVGMRKLCSLSMVDKIFQALKKPPRPNRGAWSRRSQEQTMKINSGSLLLTQEVVRESAPSMYDSTRSHSERVAFEKALHRLTAEVAEVTERSYEDVENQILEILAVNKENVKEKSNVIDDVEFDDDLDMCSEEEGVTRKAA